jgi:hypothetical protein
MSAPGYVRKSLRRKVTDADRIAVRSFARAIGEDSDTARREWLLKAAECFLLGQTLPREPHTKDAGLGRAE